MTVSQEFRARDLILVLPWRETLRRLPRVVGGLVLFGVGIALMVLADLGLGPWDVFHQGLSDVTGLGIGVIISLVGAAIVVAFVPLREQAGVGTVLNAILIGVTVDVVLWAIDEPTAMAWRVVFMLSGPVVIGVGSGFYIGGGLGPGPRDGIMTGLARRGIKVSRVRTGIEIVVLVAGLALGGTIGIGTVWFAVAIGPLVGYFLPLLTPHRLAGEYD